MQKAAVYRYSRIILCALYLTAAALIQCSVFPHIKMLGVIPDFALCAVVCVSCFEEKRVCCILAVYTGFILDTAGLAKYMISPLLFLLAAVFAMVLSEKLPSLRFLCAAAALLSGSLISSFFCAAVLSANGAAFSEAVAFSALPQLLYSVTVFIPVWLLSKLHYTVFKNEKR